MFGAPGIPGSLAAKVRRVDRPFEEEEEEEEEKEKGEDGFSFLFFLPLCSLFFLSLLGSVSAGLRLHLEVGQRDNRMSGPELQRHPHGNRAGHTG